MFDVITKIAFCDPNQLFVGNFFYNSETVSASAKMRERHL